MAQHELGARAGRSNDHTTTPRAVAPERAYVTARHAAWAPFGKAAAPLSELPPRGGPRHTGTVRNRTRRVGAELVQARAAAQPAARHRAPSWSGSAAMCATGTGQRGAASRWSRAR